MYKATLGQITQFLSKTKHMAAKDILTKLLAVGFACGVSYGVIYGSKRFIDTQYDLRQLEIKKQDNAIVHQHALKQLDIENQHALNQLDIKRQDNAIDIQHERDKIQVLKERDKYLNRSFISKLFFIH